MGVGGRRLDNMLYRRVRPDDKAVEAYIRKCHLGFHENKSDPEYLGIKASHYDGELSGIGQTLEGAREVGMLTILSQL